MPNPSGVPAQSRRHAAMHVPSLVVFAVLVSSPAWAQQPALTPPPGQGTQLHTGTSSGLTLDARIEMLLADHQYFRVEAELGQLPPDLAQLYRGVLANRSNNLKASIALLEPLVDKITASSDLPHEKLLREALAEDYLRSGDLDRAAAAYTALEARLGAHLTADEQSQIEMPLKLLPLAKNNPPMTVEPCDPFTLQASEDPLGLTDVPVFVDADPKSWMLDPTSPFNLIDRSTAREVGLKVSNDFATIRSLTGRPIEVHMAVIPRFTIGGRLTLRNMTVFVFDDADYSFPRSKYQVEGVLGYPALAALGSLTINDDETIAVLPGLKPGPAETREGRKQGVPFFLDGDQVIVALGHDGPNGTGDRMYAVDAGGQQTYLTSRYFDEHAAAFNGQKVADYSYPGLQLPQPAYLAETVPLTVGQTTVDLHDLRVLTQPLGMAALDDVYGVLGVDALGQLGSYTFDYRTMRFSVRGQ